VLYAGAYRWPVLPGRPAVAVPGQLEDAGCAADALHAQAGAEATASGAQVVDEGGHGLAGAAALVGCEAVKVDALKLRAQAVRRADRLGSYTRPRTVAVPAASRPRPRSFHTGPTAGRVPERTTHVDTVEQTRRTLAEAALAEVQESARERAALLVHGPRPQTAPATAPPQHMQQPGTQHTPGRTTGGVM
jgi:hypothetical protein